MPLEVMAHANHVTRGRFCDHLFTDSYFFSRFSDYLESYFAIIFRPFWI